MPCFRFPKPSVRQQEIFRSKLKGLALVCVPLVSAMARPRPPSAVVSGSAGTPVCRVSVTTCAPFKCKTPTRSNHGSKSPMPTVKIRASTILGEFGQAQFELVGKAVILTDGKAGTVENVWLDEMHGLRISIRGHDGKWPISTVKFAQTG